MSKKPTGITISRDAGKYAVSWKCGDKNYSSGQQFQYRINGGKWTTKSVSAGARSATVSVNLNDYYPYEEAEFITLEIRIRGKKKKSSWSGWASKTYTNKVPDVPNLESSLNDQQTNICTFTWNETTETTDEKPFAHVKWETILVRESDISDGKDLVWDSSSLGWDTGSGSSASSITKTEDTMLLAEASYTRWVRVRGEGARGASDWRYEKHVYARPFQAQIEFAEVSDTGAEGLTGYVQWTADQTPSHPIDHTTVQYLITVPNSGLTCPSGAQWNDANISADTEASDAVRFSIDDVLDKDECLFVRVNTIHDSNITYSNPALASIGELKDPTDLSYQLDNANHSLTSVSVDNNSDVPDSFIVLVYRAGSNPEEMIVGIIPHNASQPLILPVVCPDWSEESAFSIGAYAAVGSYERTEIGYTVNVRMRSRSTVWVGGAIPVAPENVNVIQSEITGTATVTWDWTWAEATFAQLSWTNHADAWESTDEPEVYTISKSRATRWNISGLEVGTKWYIAVRLVSGNPEDETAIYGPWSELIDITLSSVPNVPSLGLSSNVITVGEEITASWEFVSNDGTGQISAEIKDENDNLIAHTTTEKEVVIDTGVLGWAEGEMHSLSVRVTSESRRTTAWSNPVSIAIAEPLECTIAQTSLENETIETNPREFSGDSVSFDTEMAEDFTKLEVAIEPTQSGSGTPSPSNVRPIYGVGGVDVDVVGKNLLDTSMIVRDLYGVHFENDESGVMTLQGTCTTTVSTSYLIGTTTNPLDTNLKAGVEYYFSWSSLPAGTTAYSLVYLEILLEDGTIQTVTANSAFTLAQNGVAKYVRYSSQGTFAFTAGNTYNIKFYAQIAKGSATSAYEPYQGQTVSQEFDVSLTPTSKDTDPYLFKAVGDIYGDRLEEDIVSGTVCWNQHVNGYSDTDTTHTTSGGVVTITPTSSSNRFVAEENRDYISVVNGHKYLATVEIKSDGEHNVGFQNYLIDGVKKTNSATWIQLSIIVNATSTGRVYFQLYSPSNTVYQIKDGSFNVVDLTAFFGNTAIADAIYNMERATEGSGVALLKASGFFNGYTPYDTGTLKSVNPTSHVTRGVNAWDEEWRNGVYSTTTGAFEANSNYFANKNPIRVLPNTTYYLGDSRGATFRVCEYDQDGLFVKTENVTNGTFTTSANTWYINFNGATTFYGTTYNNDICINISDPTINGQYYPYEEHTYDLGNVPLYGVFQLENNKLKAYGDVRHAVGGTDRKFGVVTLNGSEPNWKKSGSALNGYYVNMVAGTWLPNGYMKEYGRVVAVGYEWTNDITTYFNNYGYCYTDYTIGFNVDPSKCGSTLEEFKVWLAQNPITVVYELATPTTEQTDPFTQIQEVSKYGTLEYITTNGVPVGHNTTYLTRDIFGGYIDLVSGQLVVDRIAKIPNIGVFSELSSGYSNINYLQVYKQADSVNINNTTVNGLLTSMFTPEVGSNWDSTDNIGKFLTGATYTQYWIGFPKSTTLEQAQATVAGLQICYKLATPLTYQLTPQQINTLVGVNNVWSDSDMEVRIAESSRDILALKEMPLTVQLAGVNTNIVATVTIKRTADYHMDRPDETQFDGFEGEMVYKKVQSSNDETVINVEDLIGRLDDGAPYKIMATFKDVYGQSTQENIDFEVHWNHQALIPEASCEIDEENLVAVLTPIAPIGTQEGDTCDIYRLSADRPELIVKDAIFGTEYVDPYPAIGEFGGHRFVFKTKNGDYITEDSLMAMTDTGEEEGDILDVNRTIIDFDGNQLLLYYNVDVGHEWEKDSQRTKYLGGSIDIDWNAGVSRNGSVSATMITLTDQEQILLMRELAEYIGACHIRTKDGSSFTADIQVSEDRDHSDFDAIATFSMTINGCDAETLDGLTFEQWSEGEEEEE